jgi:UDP-N-acetylglucosamine:LPS N-acetylglucosamine transferase
MLARIFESPQALADMAAKAHSLATPHAAQKLADAVERLAERKAA